MSSNTKHSLIVLTGFMGSGKSTIGRALASLLNWNFVDLDCEIEKTEGRRISEIFSQDGEAHFREIEANVLRSLLAELQSPAVLSSGGGTYVQPTNADLLRAARATVVFLEVPIETMLQRCCSEDADPNRPLAGDREAFLYLYEKRLPLYRTANLTVVTDNKESEFVAQEIAERLGLVEG